ncbi:MAG TPA: DUF2721 domain-containing protein [Capsulimonadaceae bacterium]|nr:DUF2721 domain-containing protein [Capsulimonadaceae bacterium]
MNPFGGNPFTMLTLIAAPAVLTNASSVLALGTSNRFARAVDRARALAAQLESKEATGDPVDAMRIRQIGRLERRIKLLLDALAIFYASLGSFAAASLISLLGASLATSTHHILFRVSLGIALVAGVVGVGGLVVGCSLLVTETRIAVANLTEEADFVRHRYSSYLGGSDMDKPP